MKLEPGHAPMDDFTLAVETVRFYAEAFESFSDDIHASGIDAGIFSHETVEKLHLASQKRKELSWANLFGNRSEH